jgi:hypothetical protein
MGGLEGLINILDSEGGFGSLEMQVDNLRPDLWFGYIHAVFLTHTSKLLAFPGASSSSLE